MTTSIPSTLPLTPTLIGKGFLATLVGVVFPAFTVTAIDIRDPCYLPHWGEAGVHNVRHCNRTLHPQP